MPGVLRRWLSGLAPPKNTLGSSSRSGQVTTTRDDLVIRLKRAPQLPSHQHNAPHALPWALEPGPALTDGVCLAEMAAQHVGGVTVLTELQFQQVHLHLAVLDKQAVLHDLGERHR